MYRYLPLRTIRFCRLVIECNAISVLMDDAGNAPLIHHWTCVDRCGRGGRETAGETAVTIRERPRRD